MQYFIVTDHDIEKEGYKPYKFFSLSAKDDIDTETMFVELIDAFVSMYDGMNVIVQTKHNHNNIHKIFDFAGKREIDGLCTVFYTDVDDADFLDDVNIDRIVVDED